MTSFNRDLARDAAGLIPGLNADEQGAVVAALQNIAADHDEPDMTLKEAKALAESFQKAVEKMLATGNELLKGVSGSVHLADEAIALSKVLQFDRQEELRAAAAIATRMDAIEIKGGHGGIAAQLRGRVAKKETAYSIAHLWHRMTLQPAKGEAAVMFIEVAYAAVTGDNEQKGITRLIPGVAATVADNHARIGPQRLLEQLEDADALDADLQDEATRLRRIRRARYRRLLAASLQEG